MFLSTGLFFCPQVFADTGASVNGLMTETSFAFYFAGIVGLLIAAIQTVKKHRYKKQVNELLKRESGRQRLIALVEMQPDPVLILNGQGKILYCNPAFSCKEGPEPAADTPRNLSSFLPRRQRSKFFEKYFPAVNVAGEVSGSTSLVFGDNETMHADFTLMSFHEDEEETLLALFLKEVDCTEREESEDDCLRRVLDSLPFAIWWKDESLEYRGCNRCFAEEVGLSTPDKVIGKKDSDMPWKGESDIWSADDRTVLRCGELMGDREVSWENGSGNSECRKVKRILLSNVFGDAAGVLGINENLTEVRREIESASKKLKRFEMIFRLNPEGVLLVDGKNYVVSMNPAAERILGRQLSDCQYKHLLSILPFEPEIREEKPIPVFEEEVYNLAGCVFGEDGVKRSVVMDSVPIFDGEKTEGALITIRDVSDLSRIRSTNEQSLKIESICEVAENVARDFNNMLGAVFNAADLLSSEIGENGKQATWIRLILESAENASLLTTKLLTFSGKRAPVLRPTRIGDILANALSVVERRLTENQKVERCFKGGDPVVSSNASQLQNAIVNLCFNACEAMPDGGLLTIETDEVLLDDSYCTESKFNLVPGAYFQIRISDEGQGIPEGILGKIFDPFFTTRKQGRGHGLGLSIVFNAASDHKGAVTVQSEEGVGSTFTLLLPKADNQEVDTEEEFAKSALVNDAKHRILVVDDEEVLRESLRYTLESMGFEVITAVDGEQGVEMYEKHCNSIKLAIVDMVMPKLSGTECYRRIREINPDATVIITSGFAGEISIQSLQGEGVADVLRKPFRRHDLSNMVRKALR